MNTLDSRFLQLGNCFGHRFSGSGTFGYSLSPLPASLAVHHGEQPDPAVVVTAAEAGAGGQRQHYVTVSAVSGTLRARPAQLQVTAGDLVVWSADKSVTSGFRVRGRIGEQLVDSAALRDESVFTHAFGLPGTYEWADANGSGLTGRVRVAMPPDGTDQEEWLSRLEQGTLVHVRGDRAEPSSVDVLVGQTVVWAIQDAPGVSITDTSSLSLAAPPSKA
jgi:plastocyanin